MLSIRWGRLSSRLIQFLLPCRHYVDEPAPLPLPSVPLLKVLQISHILREHLTPGDAPYYIHGYWPACYLERMPSPSFVTRVRFTGAGLDGLVLAGGWNLRNAATISGFSPDALVQIAFQEV